MPDLDGQDALKKIRDIEKEKGIGVGEGAKIIMITAMDDDDNRLVSFLRLCDGYLTKPLQKVTNNKEKVQMFEPSRDLKLSRFFKPGKFFWPGLGSNIWTFSLLFVTFLHYLRCTPQRFAILHRYIDRSLFFRNLI